MRADPLGALRLPPLAEGADETFISACGRLSPRSRASVTVLNNAGDHPMSGCAVTLCHKRPGSEARVPQRSSRGAEGYGPLKPRQPSSQSPRGSPIPPPKALAREGANSVSRRDAPRGR
ncbi:putative glycosyl transferase [Streptomyces sp. Tu6071]|nr:putative glycosyl transferase [Streptomyces sp. Tu6071]